MDARRMGWGEAGGPDPVGILHPASDAKTKDPGQGGAHGEPQGGVRRNTSDGWLIPWPFQSLHPFHLSIAKVQLESPCPGRELRPHASCSARC